MIRRIAWVLALLSLVAHGAVIAVQLPPDGKPEGYRLWTPLVVAALSWKNEQLARVKSVLPKR